MFSFTQLFIGHLLYARNFGIMVMRKLAPCLMGYKGYWGIQVVDE